MAASVVKHDPGNHLLAFRWPRVVHDQREKAGAARLQSRQRAKRKRNLLDRQEPRLAHRRDTPVVRGHLPLDGAVPEGASVDTGRAASAQSAEEGLHGGQRGASRGRWARRILHRCSLSPLQRRAGIWHPSHGGRRSVAWISEQP